MNMCHLAHTITPLSVHGKLWATPSFVVMLTFILQVYMFCQLPVNGKL